jgi:DeoR family fructose operon transcriptional repressor
MKGALRHREILKLLSRSPELSVVEFSEQLGVSEATVRRDLHKLEAIGKLKRTHGGATLAGIFRSEPRFNDKQSLNPDAKDVIAMAALELIDDGDRIYLDGGSTLLALARLLDQRRALTIVTNSLIAAAELMDTEHRLILVGGEFRALSRTLVGPLTAPLINSLHVDKAFMGTIGFTLEQGMTTTEPSEAFVKEQVMHRANQVVLLADSNKIGVSSFARSGSLNDIDLLITEKATKDFQGSLDSFGIELIIANCKEQYNG